MLSQIVQDGLLYRGSLSSGTMPGRAGPNRPPRKFFEEFADVSASISDFIVSAKMEMGFIEPNVGSDAMTAHISALSIYVAVLLTCFPVRAQEGRSRSLLALDQSDLREPFCHSVFSGRGIHIEKLNEVCDPFFTTRKQGAGIVLPISRTLVQAHKGRIWAENQKEGRAELGVSLPVV